MHPETVKEVCEQSQPKIQEMTSVAQQISKSPDAAKRKNPTIQGQLLRDIWPTLQEKKKKNNTGHIVTENHLGGVGEREKICQDFSNINHATSIKSYARIVNKEAVWEQHLREKT